MPKDYMAPGGDDADTAQAGDASEGEESKSENTALLSKSFFCGESPDIGSSVTIEVVAVHGDEIEVKCSKQKGEDSEEKPEGDSSEMKGAMGKIDSLAG